MKTDIIKTESEKRPYAFPIIESIKLDNEISLILNSPLALPGDPNSGCGTDENPENVSDSPWE